MRAALRVTQLVEQLVEVPTTVSYSSLLQRTVEQTVDIPASRGRGLRGGIEGFFPGQGSTAAVVDIPVPRGDLQGFFPGQGSTASSSHSLDAENEAGVGGFRTFPRLKKSAASAAILSPIVPASVSSWTRAAYEDLDAADEPAELEDDAEPLIEEEEDPSGWSVAPSASGRPFFWHRISRRSVWKLPPGASVRKKKGRRKWKKRRKRRTPRSPRSLFRARARCRQRQWHVSGFPCDVSLRVVFPSGVVRLKMLRTTAGMDQKDYCSGMDNDGFAGDPTPRAVSSLLRGCLRILRNAWFATGYLQFGTLHPVSSGKYSGTCVFTAPVAELTVMSFTVPLDGCTIVATTIVVTSYSSSADCPDSAAPLCCGSVCVAMSCGGGFFTPGGAYDSVWDSVKPMTGKCFFNYFQYQEFVGSVCMLNYWFSRYDEICPDNYNFSRFKFKDKCRSEKWELYLYGDRTIQVVRAQMQFLDSVTCPLL